MQDVNLALADPIQAPGHSARFSGRQKVFALSLLIRAEGCHIMADHRGSDRTRA